MALVACTCCTRPAQNSFFSTGSLTRHAWCAIHVRAMPAQIAAALSLCAGCMHMLHLPCTTNMSLQLHPCQRRPTRQAWYVSHVHAVPAPHTQLLPFLYGPCCMRMLHPFCTTNATNINSFLEPQLLIPRPWDRTINAGLVHVAAATSHPPYNSLFSRLDVGIQGMPSIHMLLM